MLLDGLTHAGQCLGAIAGEQARCIDKVAVPWPSRQASRIGKGPLHAQQLRVEGFELCGIERAFFYCKSGVSCIIRSGTLFQSLQHIVERSKVEVWRLRLALRRQQSARGVRGELEGYGAGLDEKPEIIALTKTDLLDDKPRAKLIKALEKSTGATVFPISAPLGEGIDVLLDAIIERLGDAAAESKEAAPDEKPWTPL